MEIVEIERLRSFKVSLPGQTVSVKARDAGRAAAAAAWVTGQPEASIISIAESKRAAADLHNAMTKLEWHELQALRDQIRFKGAVLITAPNASRP